MYWYQCDYLKRFCADVGKRWVSGTFPSVISCANPGVLQSKHGLPNITLNAVVLILTFQSNLYSYWNKLLGSPKLYDSKWNWFLSLPFTRGDASYWKVSLLIMSIMGIATLWESACIRSSNGSSHWVFTSQWLSRNTKTCNGNWKIMKLRYNFSTTSKNKIPAKKIICLAISLNTKVIFRILSENLYLVQFYEGIRGNRSLTWPVAWSAPIILALIRPSLRVVRTSLTFGNFSFKYVFNSSFKWAELKRFA